MTLEDFASRLKKPNRSPRSEIPKYIACCPAHDDNTPSFAVWEGGDGWLHMKCQRGCSEDAILKAMNLTESDRRIMALTTAGAGPGETVYTYHDEDGTPLFEKVRYLKEGKKTFYQRLPGAEKSGLGSLNGKSKVLYHLPEVLKAVMEGKTVFINEGEKAVDELRKIGAVATCQPGGATTDRPGSKWMEAHTALFKGATVVVVADRDEVGETFASYVGSALRGVAKSVRIVQSKTENPKDDAYDHIRAGHSLDDFVDRRDLLPRRGFETKKIESFDLSQPEYLFGTHIRLGQINLLDGDGGGRKTALCLALAASGSVGYDPISNTKIKPFRTLYFGTEDEEGELRSVYEDFGGLPDFLEVYTDIFQLDTAGLRAVRETIEDGAFKLTVFDVLFYYMGGLVKNTNDGMELAPVLKGLRDVAMATDTAILNLRHTGKGKLGKTPAEYGLGAAQIRNSHRSQLLIRLHPDQANQRGVRIVTHEKGSIQTELGQPFGFSQRGKELTWIHNPDMEAFEPEAQGSKSITAAKEFLVNTLTGQFVLGETVISMAADAGISGRTLQRASEDLVTKSNRGWPDRKYRWTIEAKPEEEYNPYDDV